MLGATSSHPAAGGVGDVERARYQSALASSLMTADMNLRMGVEWDTVEAPCKDEQRWAAAGCVESTKAHTMSMHYDCVCWVLAIET